MPYSIRWNSLVLTAALFMAPCSGALATTYYVGPAGKDANSGLSPRAPLQNIQTAANLTQPGDTVYVLTGTYGADPTIWHDAVLYMTASGTAGHPITFSAYPGQHPVITTAGNTAIWNAVQITGSYIVLAGFEIIGNAQSVTLAQATNTAAAEEQAYLDSVSNNQQDPSSPIVYPGDPATNGQCVSVNFATHVSIKNNLVHDCSANGIDVESSDYSTIDRNVVFNTSWWTVYGTSGINLHLSLNSDSSTGYHNFVTNNISHDNANTQSFFAYAAGTPPLDGNGIIIDTNQSTNDGQPYLGRTLIMGNIVYDNGGSGIHAFLSAHVDIFNNTAYNNNNCPVPGSTCGDINEGQIFGNAATDVAIYNNILSSPNGKLTYSNWNDTAVSESHNIMHSMGGGVVLESYTTLSPSDIVAAPLLSNIALLNGKSFAPQADTYNISHPKQSVGALLPQKGSPALIGGTNKLNNGQPMLVTPKAMNGNQIGKIAIGALSGQSGS